MFIVEFSFLSVRLFSLQIKKFLKLMNKFNIKSIERCIKMSSFAVVVELAYLQQVFC